MKVIVEVKLDNSVDTTKSAAVQIPGDWARFISVFVPDIVVGAVTMEFIKEADVTPAKLVADQNTDWNPVEVAIDSVGALSEVMASGADPTWIDISRFVRALPEGYIRFVTAGTQNAVTTWYVAFGD